MDTMSQVEFDRLVIAGAKDRIGHEPWFRGVCLDSVGEFSRNKTGLREAIEQAIADTILWDAQL